MKLGEIRKVAKKAISLYNADTYDYRLNDLTMASTAKGLIGVAAYERCELTIEALCQGILMPKQIALFVEAGLAEERYKDGGIIDQ